MRGDSIASWTGIPKRVRLRKTWRFHWSWLSPPGVPKTIRGRPRSSTSEGVRVVRGRLPGREHVGMGRVEREHLAGRLVSGKPRPGTTGDAVIHAPLGVALNMFRAASTTLTWRVPRPGGPAWAGASASAFSPRGSPGRISSDARAGSISPRRTSA